MKKGVTIKDIARKLNMSVSTVSKALNDDVSISDLTKERVKQLAKEWNYVPNEAARHFKLNKTFTLGLIIPNLLDQYYVLAANGVDCIAEKEKYNVIFSQSNDDPGKELKIIDVMIRSRVDGVIVAITKNTVDMAPFEKLLAMGIPVVCMAREPKSTLFDYVSSNNEEGAFKATDFLVKRGHQKVAHIMGPASMKTCQVRLEGYKQALQKHKIPYDESLVKVVDFSPKSTETAMKQLMQCAVPPTAIFTFKNYITLDAIEYLKKKHPDFVSKVDFVGFGNLPLLQYLDHKPLASIEERSYEMGEEAATLLFQRIHDESEETFSARNIQITCKLVVHK